MEKYKVIQVENEQLSECLSALVYVVDQHLVDGFSLQGGVSVIYMSAEDLQSEAGEYIATQAMVNL